MLALLVDTAGPVAGVAAFVDGRLVAAASARVPTGTEAWLGGALRDVLAALPGLDRVAVTVGPGAFTGLRVGVAAALGVAVARRVPVAPVSSLALRACLAPGEPRVLALLDARKGKVYAGSYTTLGPSPSPLEPEADLAPAAAAAVPSSLVVGEGGLVYAAELIAAGHRIRPDAGESPVAYAAGLLAHAPILPPEAVGLRYLREPDARPSQV